MKKAVIIGAGPAGICAAHELLTKSKDYSVVILEESEHIGGISKTIEYHGNRMDMGGHRFFSKEQRVNDWWKSILRDEDPAKSDLVLMRRNRLSRIYYKNHFFDYPVKINLNTIRNMGILTTITAGLSYLRAAALKKPEDSLENFYINRFGRKLYEMFFRDYTKKVWGRSPADISADWGSQRVKGLSVFTALKNLFVRNEEKEVSLIEQFDYPKYGPGQLWEQAAGEVEAMGGVIITGCRVTDVVIENNSARCVRYEKDGVSKEIICDTLFSSMALKDLVHGIADVPEDIREIADGLLYREFVTSGVLLMKDDLTAPLPDCWIYVQDSKVKMGRIQVFNNWSPYMVDDPEKHIWLGLEYFCDEGDVYWNKSEAEWKKLAVSELSEIKLVRDSMRVLDFHTEKVKKAYPAYFGTYDRIEDLRNWLNRIENLYCIGRNGQHRYNNMDHSMMTAFRAVELLLSGNPDKSSLWNINTDKSYHETR